MFSAFHTDLQQIFWCSEQDSGRCWEDSKGPAWCEVLTFLDNSALVPFPVEILNKHKKSLLILNYLPVNKPVNFRILLFLQPSF